MCLYVNDLIVLRNVQANIKQFKVKMKSEFEISNLGTLSYFLGLKFVHTHKRAHLHKKKNILLKC